jgi:SAM-dependent methyltransferase
MFSRSLKNYLKSSLYPLKKTINKFLFRGTNFYCPICEISLRQFNPHGVIIARENALCPVCGSVERHRLLWLYFVNETDLFSPKQKKMLHIAPERCFVDKFSSYLQIDYLTADLNNSAMVKMDITDIQYPDNSFDVIYCSHVLEHIPDDRQAMLELARVLKPGGWAILQVPVAINTEQTIEDLSITDPAEKERLFGHPDHVRIYGAVDYKNRLEMEGFQVQVIPYLDRFDTEIRHRYGLNIDKDDIYLCKSNKSQI